jgi:hypothetical protein
VSTEFYSLTIVKKICHPHVSHHFSVSSSCG